MVQQHRREGSPPCGRAKAARSRYDWLYRNRKKEERTRKRLEQEEQEESG